MPQWKGLLTIGLSMALNVGLMNSSLQTLTLSLNQIIRSALPVLTCILSYFVEGKEPTRYEMSALAVLSVGVAAAVAGGSIGGSTHGIILACLATLFQSLMITFSSKVLSNKIETFHLVFYQSPIILVALLPLAVAMEMEKLRSNLAFQFYTVAIILVATSVLALVSAQQHQA